MLVVERTDRLLDLLLPLQIIRLHQVIRDDVRQYFHRFSLGEDLADLAHGDPAINPIDDAAHALDIDHRIEPMPTFGARGLNQTIAPLPRAQGHRVYTCQACDLTDREQILALERRGCLQSRLCVRDDRHRVFNFHVGDIWIPF
ncbi:hypothetical protein D3C81_1735880 [compost metagenome]